MNTTPNPEETEREELVKLLSGILYGGGSGSMEGTDQFWKYVAEVADAILAARRLSESEIRRDQAEKAKYGECVVCHQPFERYDSPGGVFRSHFEHPADDHEAQFAPSPETEQEPRFLYARCDGSGRCSALYHVHGCFTEHGRYACDTPDAHDSVETE